MKNLLGSATVMIGLSGLLAAFKALTEARMVEAPEPWTIAIVIIGSLIVVASGVMNLIAFLKDD